MTDTEAKALALVNEFRAKCAEPTLPVTMSHVWAYGAAWEALCRAIEREAATEARHAAELREQAERFSEVAARADDALAFHGYHPDGGIRSTLSPFILPAPDPLVEGLCAAISDMGHGDFVSHETLGKALSARGYELRKIGEAGE